ncbi:unnamed protein product [Sphagnum jensenii]|uniref:Uncharacterized protein n=1 Tax=Sphagnum jensenii TaxID=128206 RepID=A0ABP0VGM6_9BRYO
MLQEIRMSRFMEAYEGYKRNELNCQEAGLILGMSERQFRRLRDRYEEEGAVGVLDRRLGKASAKRVAACDIAWVVGEYRTKYAGFTAKHFHEKMEKEPRFCWGYTWTKSILQSHGLLVKATKRGLIARKRTAPFAGYREPLTMAIDNLWERVDKFSCKRLMAFINAGEDRDDDDISDVLENLEQPKSKKHPKGLKCPIRFAEPDHADDEKNLVYFFVGKNPGAQSIPRKRLRTLEIAAVRRCSTAKLDREAWLGTGVKFVRDGSRCLYRKADVVAALEPQSEVSHAE